MYILIPDRLIRLIGTDILPFRLISELYYMIMRYYSLLASLTLTGTNFGSNQEMHTHRAHPKDIEVSGQRNRNSSLKCNLAVPAQDEATKVYRATLMPQNGLVFVLAKVPCCLCLLCYSPLSVWNHS